MPTELQELRGVLGLIENSGRPVSITQYFPGQKEPYHTQIVQVEGVGDKTYTARTHKGSFVRPIGAIIEISYLGGGGTVYYRDEREIDSV